GRRRHTRSKRDWSSDVCSSDLLRLAHFGREPEMFVSAPGRTEVIGNHTDHNRGRVLAASVDLDTVAALAPRNDSVVTMYSEGYEDRKSVGEGKGVGSGTGRSNR